MASTPRPSSSPAPATDTLVPVLDLSAGAPDPVAVGTWHMALSNLVGTEIPHQLFGLWLFPATGGVVLLGPEALAADHLEIAEPAPRVSQDQLYELEETLRRAKYGSAIAIAIGDETRDWGLAVFGTFEGGAYGPVVARRLARLADQLAPSLSALGKVVTAPAGASSPVPEDELAATLPLVVNEAPSGPELCRRLSGFLHPHVPHDRLEVLALTNGARSALPLSGLASRRRWGSGATTWADLIRLLDDFFDDDLTATIGNLAAEAPGLSWPGAAGTGPTRIGSVLAVRLTLGGEVVGLVIFGHAATDLYRETDVAIARSVAPLLASRVVALRLESEVQALRGQLEVLQAPSLPVLRAADALAATAHLGEALHRFGADVREIIPHDRIRYVLRLSESEAVELLPDAIRPLADLPLQPIETLSSRAVLDGDRPWVLGHRRESVELAIALKVADRVIGAMVIEKAGGFEAPRDAAAIAHQFAAIVAPHLELLRRGTGSRPTAPMPARRPS
jgi:hypothetical protein